MLTKNLSDILSNTLIFSVSLLLALGTSEWIARRFIKLQKFHYESQSNQKWNQEDPLRNYRLTPFYRGRLVATEFQNTIEINSLGFRGPEPDLEKEKNEWRIFLSGILLFLA